MDKEVNIYSDFIEGNTLNQFYNAMEQDFVVKGALLPDAHLGYSLPIGATIATKDMILPAWVGYDIGCGMLAIQTTFNKNDIKRYSEEIFQNIYRSIPTGFHHNKKRMAWENYTRGNIALTETAREIFEKNGLKQLCSLGGGNHFIEIGYDECNFVWIIIHSGSRGIGHAIATHYMKLASGTNKAKEGHYGFNIGSENGQKYKIDMEFCIAFALENRKQMLAKIVVDINCIVGSSNDVFHIRDWSKIINATHNHAEEYEGLWIHRKGATHALKGMKGVIPGNMKDGSFIIEGLGNPKSLYSSSHGAGRIKSRTAAKKDLNLDDFKQEMEQAGVTAKVKESTLDESPGAYKNIFEVMELQKGLVKILHHVKPLINIKGECNRRRRN